MLVSTMSLPDGGESAQADTHVPPTTLAHLRDTARPVLVLSPTFADGRTQEQLGILGAHAAESAERHVVAVVLPADGVLPGTLPAAAFTLTPADARAARERFGVAPADFAVIVLGKDGGEKLRDHAPIPFGRLEALIDAMPMRQAEIRARRVTPSGSVPSRGDK